MTADSIPRPAVISQSHAQNFDQVSKKSRLVDSISTALLAHLASDACLHDCDIRYLLGILPGMTIEGRWRGTDEAVEARTSVKIKSQPACLVRLAEAGVIEQPERKQFGQRDIVLCAKFLPGLRCAEKSKSAKSAPATKSTEPEAEETRTDNLGGNSVAQRNSSARSAEKASQNQETPDRKESLTRERKHTSARKDAPKARRSESLDSDPFVSENPKSPNGEYSLKDLAARYGVEHFPIGVLQAADCFNDLQGAAHYNMVYSTMAGSDQDIWAEAVESILDRYRAGEIESPRPYVAETVRGIVKERAEQAKAREKVAKVDKARKASPVQQKPIPVVSDAELDEMLCHDPFAADDPAEEKVSAETDVDAENIDAENFDWAGFADYDAWDNLDFPAERKPVAPAEPEVQKPAEPVVQKAQPAPARPKLSIVGILAPQKQAEKALLVSAAERLGLDVERNDLGALFSGVCKGRVEVFNLCVEMAVQGRAKSPNSFVSALAKEHAQKDAQWLRDRTAGLTTAECTEKVKRFEAELDRINTELNRPMTKSGGFRTDNPEGIGAVISKLPMDKGLRPEAGLKLPANAAEKKVLDEKKEAMRIKFAALSKEDQDHCNAAGRDLANRNSEPDKAVWEEWRRLGTFHACVALVDAATRAANIAEGREAITASTPAHYARAQDMEDSE